MSLLLRKSRALKAPEARSRSPARPCCRLGRAVNGVAPRGRLGYRRGPQWGFWQGIRITHDRFTTCTGFPAAGRFPLIFLIIWVTRFPHPLSAVNLRFRVALAFSVFRLLWF
jgi:hypothetical protein